MPKPCNHRHRSSEGPSCFELDESFPTRRHSQQSVKYCVSEPDPRDPIVDPDDRPISDLRSIFLEERARLELSFFFFPVIRRSLSFFSSHQGFASTGSSHCGINIPPIVTNEVPIESYGRVRRNRRISFWKEQKYNLLEAPTIDEPPADVISIRIRSNQGYLDPQQRTIDRSYPQATEKARATREASDDDAVWN